MKKNTHTPSLVDSAEFRVRFSEVDSMQIVWHGDYVRYLEDGRESFGRQYPGLGYMDIYENGYLTPIVDLRIQFKTPLKFGEKAVVETRYINTEAAKILFEYEIRRADNDHIVATAETTQVFLDAEKGELQLMNPAFYLKWKEQWGVK